MPENEGIPGAIISTQPIFMGRRAQIDGILELKQVMADEESHEKANGISG